MMSPLQVSSLQIGEFILTGDDVLRSPQQRRQLPRRLARVLRMLHRGAGTVVSKDELLNHCWGPDQGSEQTLAKAVSDLRAILAAEGMNWIETCYGQGYRLRLGCGADSPVSSRDRAHAICWEAAHRVHQREKSSLEVAIHLYQMAMDRYDGRSIEARIGYAEARIEQMQLGYVAPAEAWPSARRMLEEILQINPDVAAARALRALGALCVEGDLAVAQTSAWEACGLAPRAYWPNYARARVLLSTGKAAQAVEHVRRALESHPIDTNAAALLAVAHLCAGNGCAARDAALQAVTRDPDNPLLQCCYCWIEAAEGDPSRACDAGAAANRKLPQSRAVAAMFAYALARRGALADAGRLLEWSGERDTTGLCGDALVSVCRLAMGDDRGAVESLRRALRNRCWWLPMVLWDPRGARLRSSPELRDVFLAGSHWPPSGRRVGAAAAMGAQMGRRLRLRTGFAGDAPSDWLLEG